MKIIKQRWVELTTTWTREYDLVGGHGSGFTFPCDELGVVHVASLAPEGKRSLALCQGNPDYIDRGPCQHTRQTTHPAVGQCECGTLVDLARWTNTCERCGADYNGSGQKLSPRRCWGEETGETYADLQDL